MNISSWGLADQFHAYAMEAAAASVPGLVTCTMPSRVEKHFSTAQGARDALRGTYPRRR
ncbi:MAG: hypothetical protein AB7D27_11395 [Desulfomicrobium sp.]